VQMMSAENGRKKSQDKSKDEKSLNLKIF